MGCRATILLPSRSVGSSSGNTAGHHQGLAPAVWQSAPPLAAAAGATAVASATRGAAAVAAVLVAAPAAVAAAAAGAAVAAAGARCFFRNATPASKEVVEAFAHLASVKLPRSA